MIVPAGLRGTGRGTGDRGCGVRGCGIDMPKATLHRLHIFLTGNDTTQTPHNTGDSMHAPGTLMTAYHVLLD
jgi:hypothetical protein